MDIKFSKVAVLLIIYTATVFSTCDKGVRLDCAQNKYTFGTTIKAYPDLDSININDTVWLELICPVILNDITRGQNIDYSNAKNLGVSINFFRFIGGSVTDPGGVAAANSFNFNIVKGVFIPDNLLPEQNRDYGFSEMNNEYKFKLGVIPKQTGTFAIGVDNAANVFRTNDKCTKASFFIKFANTNQHLYFIEQNRPGYTISESESTHAYCFKVK